MKLLTTSNAKIEKTNGVDTGYRTAIMHLAPYNVSGHQVCHYASPGCAAACLNTAGCGVFKTVQAARIAKTKMFFEQRNEFIVLLVADIEGFIRQCDKLGLKPAIRLNGTSDIRWEQEIPSLFTTYSGVQFYDYTKDPTRFGGLPANYHLTFSQSETNQKRAKMLADKGKNVAVVFDKLPATYYGKPVHNGDENDLRFLDPNGTICGLVAKGRGKKDETGFVVKVGCK